MDETIEQICDDIKSIKLQLEALMLDSRARKLHTLSFLLQLAYEEASNRQGPEQTTATRLDLPVTLQ